MMPTIPTEDDFKALPEPSKQPPIPPEWEGDVPVNIYGETNEDDT